MILLLQAKLHTLTLTLAGQASHHVKHDRLLTLTLTLAGQASHHVRHDRLLPRIRVHVRPRVRMLTRVNGWPWYERGVNGMVMV